MPTIIIKNVDIFDGVQPELFENHHILIGDGKIIEISHSPISCKDARSIDAKGLLLMPGLIDAHYHATLVQVAGYKSHAMPPSLLYPAATKLLNNSLNRGFTTVRDAGGADFGLAHAVECGLIKGPRIFFSGRPITQTGGHGEMRALNHDNPCLCTTHQSHYVKVVDGCDEMRKAVREEFRKGAHQLKLMLNGGVSSPHDPVWLNQFTDGEIQIAVTEAQRRKSYVMAHLYMDEQIERAVKLGIRSVEHGNFLRCSTAKIMAKNKSFLVPTLVTYRALKQHGLEYGLGLNGMEKLETVAKAGLSALENANNHEVDIGFGTDLLGDMHCYQCDEFQIRKEVQTPFEILKSATSVNAKLLNRSGILGIIKEGAIADILLMSKNPFDDLSAFTEDGRHIHTLIKSGKIIRSNVN